MALESSIERDACARIEEELRVPNIKIKIRSWPDRLFLIPGGRPFMIEFKRPGPGNDAREDQKNIHRLLRKLGYEVEVHDKLEEAYEAVRRRLVRARGWTDGLDTRA